jgi:hypothetical protein
MTKPRGIPGLDKSPVSPKPLKANYLAGGTFCAPWPAGASQNRIGLALWPPATLFGGAGVRNGREPAGPEFTLERHCR